MKSKGETVNMQSVIDGLMRQLEGKDRMIQHLLNRVDELESTIQMLILAVVLYEESGFGID